MRQIRQQAPACKIAPWPPPCTVSRTGKTALYKAINTGELRAMKRGRRPLVLPADLKEWIEKRSTIERQRQSKEARRGSNR